MTYKIIDNFLLQPNFESIINTFFLYGNENTDIKNKVSWNYQKGIVRNPDLALTDYKEHDFMYVYSLYSCDEMMRFDKYYYLIKPILNKLKIKKLFDVRANLLVPTQEHIYHEFHTDRSIPHQVALFYLNDCNGFTVLKNTVEVECVQNRMLLFDGSIEHHSVTSTDNPRCVININYL